MKIIFLFALLSISINCAADDWTKEDINREIIFQTVNTVDWLQTKTIARNPNQWAETNVFLGEHPSEGKVDAYFLFTNIAHVVISNYLSGDTRKKFQYISIGYESYTITRSFTLGLRMSF